MIERHFYRSAALVVSMGLWGVAALAQPADAPVFRELAQCRALKDTPARVACYDRIAVPGDPARTMAPHVAAAPVAAAPTPAAAAFGLPAVPVQPVVQAPQSMDSRIVGRFEGWSPGTRFRLANGQVWEVVDTTRVTYDLDAPAVRVKRGVFGSFFLEVAGVSATPRVQRVE